jgi:hypothetical protein
MSLSKNEIECFVDAAIDDAILEIFKNQFYSFKEIEYAVDYLKEKIQDMDPEDFEDSVG